ncbi:hypothetical protein [Sphaerisporangium sp. NPDC051011]|uniref:hypothetical protein n=1 Tax=Sphaerisporangium sp. NPDC051011 TaxID=3155792 RepID=UPI0033CA5D9F
MKWLDQVDALGDTDAWLDGIAPSKIADFAGEADAQDADTLSRYEAVKQVALLACLTHMARMRARDDLAEMLCKRIASHVKRAKAELEEIHNAVDISDVVRQLVAEGWNITADQLGQIAPYAGPHQPLRRVRHRRTTSSARSVRPLLKEVDFTYVELAA